MENRMKYKLFLFLTLCLLIVACQRLNPVEAPPSPPTPDGFTLTPATPSGEELPLNPYAPGKGDEALQRGEVYMDSHEITMLKSLPPQFQLIVKGSLPTPCHQLRAVVDLPDAQNQIHVLLYSLSDPNTACTQVLEPFEASVPLGTFSEGSYTVFVNGEQVGEITP
jgi:hypothetical protein